MSKKVFLFPLTNSLLLKKVTLPFHIFEPRYRKMIKDSIDQQIPIAVAPYKANNQYDGEICVAGIPEILSTYPDGRMDIFITGAVKCCLTDFDSEDPYKIYGYEPLKEEIRVDESLEVEIDSLNILIKRWATKFLPDPSQRTSFYRTLKDPELLVNYCCIFLIEDIEVKKKVMTARTLKDKCRLIVEVIGPREVSLGPFMPPLKF